jgi:hypothetical protein
MRITLTKISTLIWATVASLLIILAVFASYNFFFKHEKTDKDRACERASQQSSADDALRGITVDEALCNGTLR